MPKHPLSSKIKRFLHAIALMQVAVEGLVDLRSKDTINPAIATGEVEIVCEKLHILNTSKVPPFPMEDTVEVKEDARLKFRLRDDGKDPDKKAGDGTWSLKVDVPQAAPAGHFTVDLTAFNSKGQPVLVRPKDGGAHPLAQSLTFSIEAAASK